MGDNEKLCYLCIKIIHQTQAAAERSLLNIALKVLSGLVPSLLHSCVHNLPSAGLQSPSFLPLGSNLGKHLWRAVPSRGHFLMVCFFMWCSDQQSCKFTWFLVNSSEYSMMSILEWAFLFCSVGTPCCSRLMHAVTELGRSSLRTTLLPRLQEWWREITEWMGAPS